MAADAFRYALLREVPFGQDGDYSHAALIHRFNADLANDFGNLVNRTLAMTGRYFDGARQAPRDVAEAPLAPLWETAIARWRQALDDCLLHEALAALWEFVGAANRFVDAERPWVLAKARDAGDGGAGERLGGTLGDLLEASRLLGLAVVPFMPASAPQLAAQLGLEFSYGPDGNGGPPLDGHLVWGAGHRAGPIGTPSPLFPRLEVEAREAHPGA